MGGGEGVPFWLPQVNTNIVCILFRSQGKRQHRTCEHFSGTWLSLLSIRVPFGLIGVVSWVFFATAIGSGLFCVALKLVCFVSWLEKDQNKTNLANLCFFQGQQRSLRHQWKHQFSVNVKNWHIKGIKWMWSEDKTYRQGLGHYLRGDNHGWCSHRLEWHGTLSPGCHVVLVRWWRPYWGRHAWLLWTHLQTNSHGWGDVAATWSSAVQMYVGRVRGEHAHTAGFVCTLLLTLILSHRASQHTTADFPDGIGAGCLNTPPFSAKASCWSKTVNKHKYLSFTHTLKRKIALEQHCCRESCAVSGVSV